MRPFQLLAFALALQFTGVANAQDGEVLVDGQTVNFEGNLARIEPATIESGGQSLDGVRLFLGHIKSYPAMRCPVQVNAKVYNTVTFTMRCADIPEALLNFHVVLTDTKGSWASTAFLKRSTKTAEGNYEFSWDVVNQPDVDLGIDLSQIVGINFKFPAAVIPEGTLLEIEFGEIKFVSGKSVATGHPELFKKWQEFVAGYKPDYSDSSKYLGAPVEGRLKRPLPLVQNGKALGEIVNAGGSEPDEWAAQELGRWLNEITGVEIPIVSSATAASNVKLILGSALAQAQYAQDLKALEGSDGFAVRTKGSQVYIFGATPKGTINGVMAFLENNTDIIWTRPHPGYGTVFSKKPNLSVVWGDSLDRPKGERHGVLFNPGGLATDHDWVARNRGNYAGSVAPKLGCYVEFGGGHNLQSFVPKGDPAYYPVIKGAKPMELSIWKHQICLSVPNLVPTYAANVLAHIKEKAPENMSIFNIKIEDNWGVCECAQCTAPIKLENGETLTVKDETFRSTQFYKFLNEVTTEVVKVHPKLKIQTYAYFYSAVPPKIKLHPSVAILYCPYVRKDHKTPLYSPVNDTWWKRLEQWASLTPNVVVREYFGIFGNGRPLAEVVAADLRAYYERGIRSIASETAADNLTYWWDKAIRGDGDWYDLNMMELWLVHRLYWNPDQDVEALRKYFIRRTFHEAAPAMERFFGVIREKWYSKDGVSTWGNFSKTIKEDIIEPGREAEMDGYLREAAAAAKNPVSRVLIARVTERYNKLISNFKNPVTEKPEDFPIADALKYGWGGSKNASVYATTVEADGRFTSGVRFEVKHPTIPWDPQFRCGGAFAFNPSGVDLTDNVVEFTYIPRKALPEGVLPVVTISDTSWKAIEVSTPENFTASSVAPGAMKFRWQPTGKAVNNKLIDLTKIKIFGLMLPPDQLSEEGHTFDLIDMSILPVAKP